jgi:thiol-disulfide isomerase/thioredoxin
MTYNIKLLLFFFCSFVLVISCNKDRLNKFPDPKIQAGISRIEGKVTNFHLEKGGEEPVLNLSIPMPVTIEISKYKTNLNSDGTFHFDVPVECSHTIGFIGSRIFPKFVTIDLAPGKVTNLEINFISKDSFNLTVNGPLGLTSKDLFTYNIFGRFVRSFDRIPCYKMKPEEFSHFALTKLFPDRLNRVLTDSLSPRTKKYITSECKLYYLAGFMFFYKKYIERNYREFKTKEEPDTFTVQNPPKAYYSFLKEFKLNDPQSLYNESYNLVLGLLLSNETLKIPTIGDTPIKNWLTQVKAILGDLVGPGDNELFYDMLVANAYSCQFKNELQSLSDRQKENISNYFKKDKVDFAKILIKKNEEVIRLEKEKKYTSTVINTIPEVETKDLMQSILSRYKGKVVLVDLWTTWCGPCMNAIKEIRPVKAELHDKKVVFVYITGISPEKDWEDAIKIIGGEHYRLNANQWEYVMKQFGFTAIPSYLFFDKKGKLVKKYTGYHGNKEVLDTLNGLLKQD